MTHRISYISHLIFGFHKNCSKILLKFAPKWTALRSSPIQRHWRATRCFNSGFAQEIHATMANWQPRFFFKKKWTNGQACFWTTSCGAYFPLRPIKWLMRSGLDCLLLITIIQPARSLSFLCQVVQAPKHLLIYLSLPQERREEDGRRGGAHRPLGRRRRRRCGNVHGCDELPHRGLRRAPAWIRHQCYRSVHWCRCWS